jgi:hypothetical protein
LQGEGQEFESPRLHHSRQARPGTTHSIHPSGPPETPDPTPRATVRRQVLRTVDACQDPGRRSPDPCAPSGAHRPADRWDDQEPCSGRRTASAVHLNNWIDDGSKEGRTPPAARQAEERSRFRRNDQGEPRSQRSRPALTAWSDAGGGQATQGTGWMPWRQEPMKDVAGCVKPRGVASRR